MSPRPARDEMSEKVTRRIRLLRRDRGWTSKDLAERLTAYGLPLSPTAVRYLQIRRRKHITVDELIAFAAIFQVSIDQLLDAGPVCRTCHDRPSAGHYCLNCGAESRVDELIEASSLGTPEAKALRNSVPDEVALRIVERSKELGGEVR